jgi:formamidopyrimidine-DNA glycosylase
MPELPEVETIARGLRPVLEGNRIANADVWRANVIVGPVRRFTRALEGRRIESVGRRAKVLRFDLEGGDVWWTSLRMTGMYLLEPPSPPMYLLESPSPPMDRQETSARSSARAARRRVRAEPAVLPPFARGRFDLASGHRLYYIDIRTLGKMGVVSRRTWDARAARLGPEPLERSFTVDELRGRLKRTRRRIKEVLLDQRVVAGVGNIYASEALHRAGIDPRARADRLSGPMVRELHRAIRSVLRESIRSRGTTFLTYAGSDGESGEFYERLRVYDRADERCPRCGGTVRRIVQGQRSTYFCPTCQKRR